MQEAWGDAVVRRPEEEKEHGEGRYNNVDRAGANSYLLPNGGFLEAKVMTMKARGRKQKAGSRKVLDQSRRTGWKVALGEISVSGSRPWKRFEH